MTLVRNEELLKRFGLRVRRLRTDKGLSQYQLADLANISRSQIMGIEKGTINPSLCTLQAVADGLGIELPALMALT
jgi:transcriptional regulator with XRE-family HTH domain